MNLFLIAMLEVFRNQLLHGIKMVMKYLRTIHDINLNMMMMAIAHLKS